MAATNPIGLDIGSMSIRAVETTRGKDGPAVTNSGQVALVEGAVQGGVVQDGRAVTLALKQLWSTAKFRGRQVVLGVTNPQVVVREMSVTNLPPREMRRSLPFQVRDMLPLPVERCLLDFYPLENPGGNPTVRGLLIAAPKDAVITAVQAVERAGLHVVRVDLASFALMRAASLLDSQVEAIIEIGARVTSVIVHADGEPVIVRTVPRGGAEITDLVATRLGATTEEAESLKCRIGLRAEEGPETAEVIREGLRPLVSEIRSSFAYLSASGRQGVDRVLLAGGGAALPGLVEELRSQLGVEVRLANPLARIRDPRRGKQNGSLERFRPSAAVSVGLTLGAA